MDADGDRPSGTVDPDELALSDATEERLAAWVRQCDDVICMTFRSGRTNARAWRRARREALMIWRLVRDETGPRWIVGVRDAKGVAWDEADLAP